jgi:uncharacterized protein DUF5946
MNGLISQQEAFYELSYYTLSHKDPIFIHQYIVDAYTAQNADKKTKPIAITFALVGLYLHVEKNYSGKEVQKAHMLMAKKNKNWPEFLIPGNKGDVNIFDVLKISPGPERDEKINKWSSSVWKAFSQYRHKIVDFLKELRIFD